MRKIHAAVAFAMIAIALTIITLPLWLDFALPQLASLIGTIRAVPGEISWVLSSFVDFVKLQIS